MPVLLAQEGGEYGRCIPAACWPGSRRRNKNAQHGGTCVPGDGGCVHIVYAGSHTHTYTNIHIKLQVSHECKFQ